MFSIVAGKALESSSLVHRGPKVPPPSTQTRVCVSKPDPSASSLGVVLSSSCCSPYNLWNWLSAAVCILGIYVFFMAYAFVQEHIFNISQGQTGEKFHYSIFLVFVMCASNALLSYIFLLFFATAPSQPKPPVTTTSTTCPTTAAVATATTTSDPFDEEVFFQQTRSRSSAAPSGGNCGGGCSFLGSASASRFLSPLLPLLSHRALLLDSAFVAITYVIAMVSTNYALTHVTYPTQILVKSAKMVPVVVGGFILFRKTYPWYDYVVVSIVTTAIAVFNFTGAGKPPQPSSVLHSAADPSFLHHQHPFGGPHHINTTTTSITTSNDTVFNNNMSITIDLQSLFNSTTLGMCFLFLSLLCDGMTGPRLDKINNKYKHITAVQVMLYVNIFAIFIAGITSILVEGIKPYTFIYQTMTTTTTTATRPLALFTTNKSEENILLFLLIFCFSASLGQFCIFHGLKIFGALYLTFITTTRKFFTVILSILWFEHTLSTLQWACMCMVFGSLFLHGYFSKLKKTKTH